MNENQDWLDSMIGLYKKPTMKSHEEEDSFSPPIMKTRAISDAFINAKKAEKVNDMFTY